MKWTACIIYFFSVLFSCYGQKFNIEFRVEPLNFDFSKLSYKEKGLGYYDVMTKPLYNPNLQIVFGKLNKKKINYNYSVCLDYYKKEFEFTIFEAVNENIPFYSEIRNQSLVTLGLGFKLILKLNEKLKMKAGISISEVISDQNNFERVSTPIYFFFDLEQEKSGVFQINEYPEGSGSIDNFTFLHAGLDYMLSESIDLFFNLKVKPFGNSKSYSMLVRGSTGSMPDDKTYLLNDFSIIDKFFFLGLGASWTIN